MVWQNQWHLSQKQWVLRISPSLAPAHTEMENSYQAALCLQTAFGFQVKRRQNGSRAASLKCPALGTWSLHSPWGPVSSQSRACLPAPEATRPTQEPLQNFLWLSPPVPSTTQPMSPTQPPPKSLGSSISPRRQADQEVTQVHQGERTCLELSSS